MSKFNYIELTPTQERQWSETRVALQYACPAFTHIFYSMMADKDTGKLAYFTKDIPIAATDGKRLLLNPEKFFSYSIKKRLFICSHEIGHCIFDHVGQGYKFRKLQKVSYPDGSTLPYDDHLANIAQDLVINDMLVASKVGECDKDWLHDPNLVTHKDSWLEAYRKVYRQGKGGGVSKGESFDEHLEPGAANGADPQKASERNDVEWKIAIAAGAEAARAQGKLPAAMQRFIDELLQPVVSWTDKIQAFFARKVGSGSYDWRRPDRRLVVRDIYAPGRSGFGAGTVAIAIDTSGSITDELLKRFLSEIAGVIEDVRPKRLLVMWIDAAVHRVDEIDEASDLLTLKKAGGGGTDFRPAFDWLHKENVEPDALIYLTDGYGSFPDVEPEYPTLWGNISLDLPDTHYPFGDRIDIPTPKAA